MENKALIKGAKLGGSMLPLALFLSIFEFSLPLKLESLESSLFLIGAFISISWILTTFLDIYLGSLIDRFGKKRSILIGTVIFALGAAGFAFTTDIPLLFIFNTLAYLGFDILFIAAEGFLIEISEKKDFSYATSGFFPVWQIGYVAGPLIAAFLLIEKGYTSPYYLAIPLCGLTIILFSLLFRKKEVVIKKKEPDSRFYKKFLAREYIILFSIFICAFWNSMMIIGIPLLYAIEDGNILKSALVAMAFALPFVFIDFIDGFIATKRRKRLLIIPLGLLLGSISLIMFYYSKNLLVEMAMAFSTTLWVNFSWATLEIEAGLISKKGDEAKTEGFFVLAKNIGWDISPFFFGLISQFFGIRIPFLFVALILALTAGVIIVHRTQVK